MAAKRKAVTLQCGISKSRGMGVDSWPLLNVSHYISDLAYGSN